MRNEDFGGNVGKGRHEPPEQRRRRPRAEALRPDDSRPVRTPGSSKDIGPPTANGTAVARLRAAPQMTESNPKVATNSLKNCPRPERTCSEAEKRGSPNMALPTATPRNAPITCAAT